MKSNPKSPTPWFTFKQVLTQILKAIAGLGSICYLAFWALWQFWRNWAQILLTMGWKTREVIQSSATYFTSIKTILKCQDHLRVKLYLFKKVLGPVGAIWETGSKTVIHRQGKRNNSKSSTTHFTSTEALLSCKGHARSCLGSYMTSLSAKGTHIYNNVCSSRLVILIFG